MNQNELLKKVEDSIISFYTIGEKFTKEEEIIIKQKLLDAYSPSTSQERLLELMNDNYFRIPLAILENTACSNEIKEQIISNISNYSFRDAYRCVLDCPIEDSLKFYKNLLKKWHIVTKDNHINYYTMLKRIYEYTSTCQSISELDDIQCSFSSFRELHKSDCTPLKYDTDTQIYHKEYGLEGLEKKYIVKHVQELQN